MNKRKTRMRTGILGYIPGFRTDTRWKKVIASIYYLITLICLFGDVGNFLVMAALPFFIMNIITALRGNEKKYFAPAVIAFVVLIIGSVFTPTNNSVSYTAPTATPITEVRSETPQPTSVPSDTPAPTEVPATQPTAVPTAGPTKVPTPQPTVVPAAAPTKATAAAPAISATPIPTSTNVAAGTSSGSTDMTVWIGETGTKYHYEHCRTLRGNKYEITLEEAKAQGRTPCKVCH